MVHPNSLAALKPTQFKPGQSGNAAGGPKTKPLTDAMRLYLAGEDEAFGKLPKRLREQILAWYGDALIDPRSRALLLDRVEGKVDDAPDRPLPQITFIEEHFDGVKVLKPAPRQVEAVTVERG